MGRPYAYLRKSRVPDLDTSYAPETQEREIRAMAQRFGDDGDRLVVKADWDISGDRKSTRKRTGYLDVLAAIRSGDASVIYSYSLSRLGRSVHELSGLFDLCKDRGVPIRLVADSIDTSTASGTMVANIIASVAQFESEVASERRKAQIATKVANGETVRTRRRYGEAEGEDDTRVLSIFRETGSYTATARILNAEGVIARSGKQWWPASVRLVIRRMDPSIRSEGRGRKHSVSFLFARLLRCPTCKTLLTGSTVRRGARRYACTNYAAMPHPRMSVSERLVMPWIVAEAARLRIPAETMVGIAASEAEKDALRDSRARIVDFWTDGKIERADAVRRLSKIDEQLAALDKSVQIRTVPPLDWAADTGHVNAHLRAIFEYVKLGPDMIPVYAEWTDRSLRAD